MNWIKDHGPADIGIVDQTTFNNFLHCAIDTYSSFYTKQAITFKRLCQVNLYLFRPVSLFSTLDTYMICK